jgi:hypothetical protein
MMNTTHILPLAKAGWIFWVALLGSLLLSGCVVAPAGEEVVAPEPATVVVAPAPVFVGPPVVIRGGYYRR